METVVAVKQDHTKIITYSTRLAKDLCAFAQLLHIKAVTCRCCLDSDYDIAS